MNTKILFSIFLCITCLKPLWSEAQSLPVGSPVLEDYLRRQQLLGKVDSSFSFSVRPIFPAIAFDKKNGVDVDGTFTDLEQSTTTVVTKNGRETFRIMPTSIRMQYNSKLPFGINNGLMIPNVGLQSVLTGGIYYEFDNLSIQFQPEVLLAQNKDFEGFPIAHDGSTWREYYEWLNFMDIPERFGQRNYNNLLPGQSSIRYNLGSISMGLSTENIWWGPARRNSLVMSNNAPGFLHATINTRKPVATRIGSFEGQLIAGQLQNSGYTPPHSDYVYRQHPLYVPKRDNDWRYLAGLVLAYQPKWVPGLSVGYSSVSQMYHNDMHTFADYLPIFNGGKGSASILNTAVAKRNQLSSGFFRWMDTRGHFEFYGEYGSNGNNRKFSDFITNPDLTRAFTFGFSNLIPIGKQHQYIQLGAEMTQTGQTVRETIFDKNSWYTHPHVRHGYTHRGQVLGAGNDPGSNVLFLEGAWVKDFNRIGFHVERIVYNNDFYYKRFEDIKDWRVKYIDIVPSLVADWRFGNILVYSKFQFVNSLNYKWFIINSPDEYWVPGYDKKNFVANVGVTYIFK